MGNDSGEAETLDEIKEHIGISRERVRQIQVKAEKMFGQRFVQKYRRGPAAARLEAQGIRDPERAIELLMSRGMDDTD